MRQNFEAAAVASSGQAHHSHTPSSLTPSFTLSPTASFYSVALVTRAETQEMLHQPEMQENVRKKKKKIVALGGGLKPIKNVPIGLHAF